MEQNTNKDKKQILSVDNLAVHYVTKDETVKAVNGVSFSLNYGETLGLVGETGAGKTTIAKSIIRVLPNPPAKVVSGSIMLDGEDILPLSNDKMRKIRGNRISMIFQDPMTALNPVKRVGNQIADGIQLHQGLSKTEAIETAKKMLEMVGIPANRFREYPHQFSGGMKQRVVIAIALACNPDLLIADEPTTALDVTIQAQVLDLISSLQKQKNTAMILITHDFGVVAETCDNIAIVYAGSIIEYGTKRQIFKDVRHPYTKGLFEAMPSTTKDVDRLVPINGAPPDPTHLPEGCPFRVRCSKAMPECAEGTIPTFRFEDGHECKCLLYRNEGVEVC